MDIGIGLPTAIPGADGPTLIEWARHADEAGFESLSRAAIRRVAEHGSGWIAGGGGPEMFSKTAQQVQQAWADEGRDGVPYLAATAYFALGEQAKAASRGYLRDFYSFGPDHSFRSAGE
jgi:alkanesulfonate monooxygenase SsuD/methylene tetrahydromethanopterin reductase-like flavin-dependent oxidoreductase (luciferase family)